MGHLSLRELYEGNQVGGALLLGTPKDMLSKALEIGVGFHRGPAFGKHWGHSFPKTLERREKVFI